MMHTLESVQFRAEGRAALWSNSVSHCIMCIMEFYYNMPGHVGPHLRIDCTSRVEMILSLSGSLFEGDKSNPPPSPWGFSHSYR